MATQASNRSPAGETHPFLFSGERGWDSGDVECLPASLGPLEPHQLHLCRLSLPPCHLPLSLPLRNDRRSKVNTAEKGAELVHVPVVSYDIRVRATTGNGVAAGRKEGRKEGGGGGGGGENGS